MKKIFAIILTLTVVFSFYATAFAIDSVATSESEGSGTGATVVTAVMVNTYTLTGSNVKIYDGVGADKWIHVVPASANVNFPTAYIKMYGYDNSELWSGLIDVTVVTHWFVGADVKYVKIYGGVGAVTVTATDH